MTVIACGILEGFEKRYRCPYCGFESGNIEDFAISMCWDCIDENRAEEPEDFAEEEKLEEKMSVTYPNKERS